MRVASIDIGTNTVRLLVAERGDDRRSFYPIIRKQSITRIGEGIGRGGQNGHLSKGAISRTIEALFDYKKTLDSFGVDVYRAVVTSAVREAKNADEFLSIAFRNGVTVEVIGEKEEATLSFLGVRGSLPTDMADALVFDVGGGSTEFVSVKMGVVKDLVSVLLGVVRLREKYISDYPPTSDAVGNMKEFIEGKVSSVCGRFSGLNRSTLLVGTAGTATSLAAMDLDLCDYNFDLVNGHTLSSKHISQFVETLSGMAEEEIVSRFPILRGGREDVIFPGALIIQAVMNFFGAEEMVVCDGGLLEGIVVQLLNLEGLS